MKIFAAIALLAAGSVPALAAGPLATLSAGASLSDVNVPAPAPALKVTPARGWAEAAKTAFEREIEAGGLTVFADIKELPPGARRQLEKEWATLPEGPGNESEAYKLLVNGRTAFVVQSYLHDDAMRAWIFNAAGALVAYGEGSVEKDFAWLPLPY